MSIHTALHLHTRIKQKANYNTVPHKRHGQNPCQSSLSFALVDTRFEPYYRPCDLSRLFTESAGSMQHSSLARQFRVFWLLLSILWAGHTPMRDQAQQGETTAPRVYDFGLPLFQLGDYYRAITEFKRFSLLFP